MPFREVSPFLARNLTEALLRAPSITDVKCPACGRFVAKADWDHHQQTQHREERKTA